MKNRYFVTRNSCPSCESKSNKELYRAQYTEAPISTYLNNFYNPQGGVEFNYLEGEYYILKECKSCNLVYQQDIPNDFLMVKLYEEWINPRIIINDKIKSKNIKPFTYKVKEIENVINHFDLPTSNLKFLDFGSGWGEWCSFAKSYGCEAFGCELSQSRIDHSLKLGVPILNWEEISNHQFDFINTEQVFEHIPNPLETLKYLVKSLKPNGVIKISVPNGGNIKNILSIMDWGAEKGTFNSLNAVAPLEHINCFSEFSLIKMAEKIKLLPIELKNNNVNNKFRNKKTKSFLDYSIKDILRPIYRIFKKRKKVKNYGSTYLFFSKNDYQD